MKVDINKQKIICIFYILLVLIWMIVIFKFSSATGETSDKTSCGVLENVIKVFDRNINDYNLQILIRKYNVYLRKFTHFGIYALGGIIIYIMYKNINKSFFNKLKYIKVFSILTGISYSISDEIHQYFIPNRSCELRDVCIDALGIVTGVIIAEVCIYRKTKIKC